MSQTISEKSIDPRFATLAQDRALLREDVIKYNDLTACDLYKAYLNGQHVFGSGRDCKLISPSHREIITLDDRAAARRATIKIARRQGFTFSTNLHFDEVMRKCAPPRKSKEGRWLTMRLRTLTRDLHRSGFGHSIEIYRGDELAGGLYGLQLGSLFNGASVFSRADGAGNAAMGVLIALLRQEGFGALDCVKPSHISRTHGGRLVKQDDFNEILYWAQGERRVFPHISQPQNVYEFLRSSRFSPTPN